MLTGTSQQRFRVLIFAEHLRGSRQRVRKYPVRDPIDNSLHHVNHVKYFNRSPIIIDRVDASRLPRSGDVFQPTAFQIVRGQNRNLISGLS